MRTKNISGHAVKLPPQRTCVSCRRVGEKRGLVRLVRAPDGSVSVDVTGKKAGRGAYLCPKLECWDKGINGGRLERSLGTTLTRGCREELLDRARDLTEESSLG